MVSVTLDSNVYVSALEFGGIPLHLLDAARSGAIRLDVSAAMRAFRWCTPTLQILRSSSVRWLRVRLISSPETSISLCRLVSRNEDPGTCGVLKAASRALIFSN